MPIQRPATALAAALCLALAAGGAPAQSPAPQPGVPLPEGPFLGAHGARLPASFAGVLPCEGCDGIRHHLDLWPDQVFHLRREFLGRTEGPTRHDALGRWHADPARQAIVLEGLPEGPLALRVQGPETLRPFAGEGPEAEPSPDHALESLGTLAPADLSLPLSGAFVYFADAALLTECTTGRRYPVAQEGDYLALERAYLEARAEPMAPLLATVEATIAEREAMEGPPRRTVVVERFHGVWPGSGCADARAAPATVGTYWRLLALGGEPVPVEPEGREPHLVMFEDAGALRFAATAGCNTLLGAVEIGGDPIGGGSGAGGGGALGFGRAASTLMACPPPLDRLEARLGEALAATTGFRRGGRHMALIGAEAEAGSGGAAPLALLEAVYAPGLGAPEAGGGGR